MLTDLDSTISNSLVFFAEKMWVAFANAKATHIFSAKILSYMQYLMIKWLNNDIVSFEQLGPESFNLMIKSASSESLRHDAIVQLKWKSRGFNHDWVKI